MHVLYLEDAIFIINGLRALFAEPNYITNSTSSHISRKNLTIESYASLFLHLKICKPFPQSLITKDSGVPREEVTRLVLVNRSSVQSRESLGFCLKWSWEAEWLVGRMQALE